MRDYQPDAFVAADKRLQILGDRWEAAAAVDQDRHSPLNRELEHRSEPLVVEREGLSAGMELDSPRAEVEGTPGLVHRVGGEVEADERNEPPLRARRVIERAVVGDAEAGFPVGFVETEDECATEPEAVEKRRKLLVAAAHPIDVVPEVRVDVEEVRISGEL